MSGPPDPDLWIDELQRCLVGPRPDLLAHEPGFEDLGVADLFGLSDARQFQDVLIDDDEVGGLADFERADLGLATERLRSVDRVGIDHLAYGEALPGAQWWQAASGTCHPDLHVDEGLRIPCENWGIGAGRDD